jgi:hypothetical protein
LLVDDDDVDEKGISRTAAARGLRFETLDAPTIEDVVRWARQFRDPPDDDLMLQSFVWYLRHDAFLPRPDAPPPPPPDVIMHGVDREYYESLGAARVGTRCVEPGCTRGAVAHSVLCRVHQFEMVKKRSCPFSD